MSAFKKPPDLKNHHDWELVGHPGLYENTYQCRKCGWKIIEHVDGPNKPVAGCVRSDGTPLDFMARLERDQRAFRVTVSGQEWERLKELIRQEMNK